MLKCTEGEPVVAESWQQGRYFPTPTILEAARALYNGHGVNEISRSDASATNLSKTAERIEAIIQTCRKNRLKAICFVTGVPGAGKTLVGLNTATRHRDKIRSFTAFSYLETGPWSEFYARLSLVTKLLANEKRGKRRPLKKLATRLRHLYKTFITSETLALQTPARQSNTWLYLMRPKELGTRNKHAPS